MEEISSDRGHVYTFDGYIYTLNRSHQEIKYFKCKDNRCGGRSTTVADNAPVVRKPHNHEPSQLGVDELKLKAEMRRIMRENPTMGPRQVFNAASLRFPQAAVRTGFPSVRSILYRVRTQGLPPIPQTLEHLKNILQSEEWAEMNKCLADDEGRPFFSAVVGGENEGWSAGIYFSRRLSAGLCSTTALHMDATFKTVPQNLQAAQLLTIHAEHDGHLFPFVFVLMTRKSEAAYQGVFNWVQAAIPNLAPITILSDYELAMRSAANNTWRPQHIIGCWFHFCQAIFRKMSRLGMARLVRENVEAGWAIHMMMAIPLLPHNRVETGFAIVRYYVVTHNLVQEFTPLFQYFEDYWLNVIGVTQLSVYNQRHRTNNSLESFYSKLVRVMGPHPAMWHFHEHLRREEASNWQDLERLQNNVRINRPRRRVYLEQDRTIKDEEIKLMSGQHDEAEFLHRLANCSRSLVARAMREGFAEAGPAPPVMPPHLARPHLLHPAPPAILLDEDDEEADDVLPAAMLPVAEEIPPPQGEVNAQPPMMELHANRVPPQAYYSRYRVIPTTYRPGDYLAEEFILSQVDDLLEAVNLGPADDPCVEAGDRDIPCHVCLQNKADRLAVPCGHNIVCRECLPNFVTQVVHEMVMGPGGRIVPSWKQGCLSLARIVEHLLDK